MIMYMKLYIIAYQFYERIYFYQYVIYLYNIVYNIHIQHIYGVIRTYPKSLFVTQENCYFSFVRKCLYTLYCATGFCTD